MHQLGDNVADFLLSGKDEDRTALLFPSARYTYGALRDGVEQTSRALLAMGARKGDRIILLGENSFFWVVSYLGILRAGAVCVPLAAAVPNEQLGHVLRVTDARFVIAERGSAAARAGDVSPACLVGETDILAASGRHCPPPSIGPDDLAALMFTSGSTGEPRGVMVSHGNIRANTEAIIQCLDLTAADRVLAVLPFYYCFGTSLLHTHLRVGGSVVVDPRFRYPEAVLQTMGDTSCTGFAGVPSHFQILLRKSSFPTRRFPHLRYVQQAGGHLSSAFVRELIDALPGVRIFIMYGQTEATARLACVPPELLSSELGSIGKGIPGVSLRVVDGAGREVRPGEVGEIVARGPNVALGYWRAPEETAASFRGGALYTGDLATVDDDGFIYIVDRAKDFLKCGGARVSCRYIEDVLLASGEVIEAAVVGLPDEVLGECAKAFVAPRIEHDDGLVERLTTFCKSRLPAPCVPRQVTVVSRLPKNTAGKVMKQSLKQL